MQEQYKQYVKAISGEGGIRTPGTLRYAAFRMQCIQPDSATSPFMKMSIISKNNPA